MLSRVRNTPVFLLVVAALLACFATMAEAGTKDMYSRERMKQAKIHASHPKPEAIDVPLPPPEKLRLMREKVTESEVRAAIGAWCEQPGDEERKKEHCKRLW